MREIQKYHDGRYRSIDAVYLCGEIGNPDKERAFVPLDEALEIIDNGVKQAIAMECLKENGVFKDDGKVGDVARFGEGIIRYLSSGIEALKGGDKE